MNKLLALLLLIPSLSFSTTSKNQLSDKELEVLIEQIYGCVTFNIGGLSINEIHNNLDNLNPIIQLNVNEDKTVNTISVINKEKLNNPVFKQFSEMAINAFQNPDCSPLKLPTSEYEVWKVINMNFDFSWMFDDISTIHTNDVVDNFFKSENCTQIQLFQASCEKDGVTFYGRFKDHKKNDLGVYLMWISDYSIIAKLAEHSDGKLNGVGQTLLITNEDFNKPQNNWIQKYTLKYKDYDYPTDFNSELKFPGYFEDELFNYSIIGRLQAPMYFIEDDYYLMDYSHSSENNNFSGKSYHAKIDMETIKKKIKQPKDGLASIISFTYDEKEQRQIWNKYIGYIRNGLPEGYGLIEKDFTPRKAEDMDIPSYDYYNPLNNKNIIIGSFSKGELVSENLEIFNIVDINKFEKELYSLGFYYAALIDDKNDFEYGKKPLLDFINKFIENY